MPQSIKRLFARSFFLAKISGNSCSRCPIDMILSNMILSKFSVPKDSWFETSAQRSMTTASYPVALLLVRAVFVIVAEPNRLPNRYRKEGRLLMTSAPVNQNKALWEKGDFTRIADTMRESGAALVQRIGVGK